MSTRMCRRRVEHASLSDIRNPRRTKYLNLIEGGQHKFLRFAARVLGNPMGRTNHDCGPALQSLKIATLADRREIADMVFLLYKIINSLVNCSELVTLITFNAPERLLRIRPLFAPRLPAYFYYTIYLINRATWHANQQFNRVDPFIGLFNSFRVLLFRQLALSRTVN